MTSIRWSRIFLALILLAWGIVLGNANVALLASHEQQNTQQYQPAPANAQKNSKAQNPPSSKESPKHQQKKTGPQWYQDPQWVTVVIIGIYTLATIVYAFFAGGQWRAIRDQGKAIRDQADIATRALVLAQRPRLVVRNVVIVEPELHTIMPKNLDGIGHLSGRLSIANIGGTQAHITEAGCWVYAITSVNGELPMIHPYEGLFGNATDKIKDRNLPPGHITELRIDDECEPTDAPTTMLAEMSRSTSHQTRLWIMGWIDYRDEVGNNRRTAFCRFWHDIAGRFEISENADYEYSDQEPQVTRII